MNAAHQTANPSPNPSAEQNEKSSGKLNDKRNDKLSASQTPSAAIAQAIDAACRRIAPTWPLDRLIAVNPWWGFVQQPVREAAAQLGHLCGSPLTMPLDWYLAQHAEGHISDSALREALTRYGELPEVEAFRQYCAQYAAADAPPARMMLLTDALDLRRDLQHQAACRDIVTHAIGQHCASWFDQGQARWCPTHAASLYATWREVAMHDNGPSLLTGIPGIAQRIARLPEHHEDTIREACVALNITDAECESYFAALLLSVNGWAAWSAYLRWQAELKGDTDDHLVQLLAMRLAWEWVLADCGADDALRSDWEADRRAQAPTLDTSPAWIWQEALERTWQQQVNRGLALAPLGSPQVTPHPNNRAALQAVFCIDVRSEPMRRALESCDKAITTHGFAGFFGLPIEYLPFGGRQARPQLPGLLAPKLRVVNGSASPLAPASVTEQLQIRHRARLGMVRAWHGLRTAASSGFGFVETTGLSYAWKLLSASLAGKPQQDGANEALSAQERAQLQPMLEGVTPEQKIDLAAKILGGMSLRANFAPLVLLIGHGSHSANNPHAAGLDCGACCGQTGEVNARVLANLLNEPQVRAGLAAQGILVPDDTRFVAGLHNTTTDDITLFDSPDLAHTHGPACTQARLWLEEASQRLRAERAPTLGLAADDPARLHDALKQRARDWSQVRPEWGLTNNAGFIAAPRERTRHMNLQGRSFLHDYRHADDRDESVLELILTAPMVVGHWINMQYYASTVDNRRWGSGNKVLHNVVGGHIGVFEGNGGDLRIGLPLQSLHDGERWRHTPQRLSVWIEAPRASLARLVQKHDVLRQLVHGEWLHLFSIEPESGSVFRYCVDAHGEPTWRAETVAS